MVVNMTALLQHQEDQKLRVPMNLIQPPSYLIHCLASLTLISTTVPKKEK